MLPVEGAKFTGLQKLAARWPEALKQAAALCTSLMLVRKKQVVGDVADKQTFKAVEARFVVTPCCLERFLTLDHLLFSVLIAVVCLSLMSTTFLCREQNHIGRISVMISTPFLDIPVWQPGPSASE